jgi:flavin-dependent dehydrogenase
VRARFVVAADGASSRLSAQAGVRRNAGRPLGIAARRYYRTTRRMDPVMESYLNFRDPDTGGVIAGYGWLFPLDEGLVNVGAGLLNTYPGFKRVSARRILDIFLAQLPPEWGLCEENAAGPVLSGPIPMGINRDRLALPGMVLVGDAGGMVNPFNGEGIGFAIETGELAAELIGDALARGRPGVAQMYPAMVRQRYGRYFFIGNNWARMIGHPRFMRFAVEHGFPRRRLMEFALRMMAYLTDGKDGSGDDKLIHLLLALAPEA